MYIGNYTYEAKGSQNINSTTAGGERVKISLAFTASASGSKLPILVVLPRKFPLKHPFVCPENVVIIYKQGSKTFDTAIMKHGFVNEILLPYIYRAGLKKACLHLDNSRVHKRADLLQVFARNKIKTSFFPPRMTSLLQPADVGWFRSLKAQYHSKWQDWYLNAPKAFTKNHNLKSPGYAKVM